MNKIILVRFVFCITNIFFKNQESSNNCTNSRLHVTTIDPEHQILQEIHPLSLAMKSWYLNNRVFLDSTALTSRMKIVLRFDSMFQYHAPWNENLTGWILCMSVSSNCVHTQYIYTFINTTQNGQTLIIIFRNIIRNYTINKNH